MSASITGKPLIDKVIILLTLASTLSLLGLFFYTEMIFKKPLPQDKTEFEELKKEGMKANISKGVTLDRVVVNLKSQKRLRFLSMNLHLVPFKESHLEKIESKKQRITDIIIDIASDMTAEELNTISGKIVLESRIKKRFNELFPDPILKEIYFSNFVVQ